MQRDSALSVSPLDSFVSRIPSQWRVPLFQLAFVWTGLIVWFWSDWVTMADQWWNSSTYNHILLVPAIVIWLVWARGAELLRLTLSSWWPGLLLVAGAMLLWLLGAISGLNLARQLGAVVALQGSLIALVGPRVTMGLIFPLGYMLFLVPFGDELVPPLQMITAKLTIGLTHISGIPAVIDGVFIDTPGGLFEVAEECSGVKFLIAMVALATLVAQVCFTSWSRRIAFLGVAIVLPILANGVRAWGTIYIAQSQGIEFAAGFDHIFYGWIFFAIVMAALLGLGWRFFDRAVEDPLIDVGKIESSPFLARISRWQINGWIVLAAVIAMALLVTLWSARADALSAKLAPEVSLPQVEGWELVEYEPEIWWEPLATGAEHRMIASYRDPSGRVVDVFTAIYSTQDDGREAGGFGQGALVPNTQWRWLQNGPAMEGAKTERLFAEGRVQRLAATFYRTGDLLTGSNVRLKLANMRDRLLMNEQATMMLILSAEEGQAHKAQDNIEAFRSAIGPVGDWMDDIAQLP